MVICVVYCRYAVNIDLSIVMEDLCCIGCIDDGLDVGKIFIYSG